MRILVIDDDPDVQLLCRVNLEFEGHEVLEAANGDMGLEIARRERPDLVILDLMLPERDGLSVLHRLHEREETRDIPVLLLTAKVTGEDQVRGWSGGADEYVTKPFSPMALAEAVVRVAEMSPDERASRRQEKMDQLAVLYRL